jgi:predicted Zn-ribbon and HTH transcriptional regulator
MSVSILGSDFDDKASEPMEHLKHPDTSKRKAKNYYNHSRHGSIFFQICQSCFWCASNLYKSRIMKRCPSCKSNKINSLSV